MLESFSLKFSRSPGAPCVPLAKAQHIQPAKREENDVVAPAHERDADATIPATPTKLMRGQATETLTSDSPKDVVMPGSAGKSAMLATPKSTPIRSPPTKKTKPSNAERRTLFGDEDSVC